MKPTYVLLLDVGREIREGNRRLNRADFFIWLWKRLAAQGLLGIHEGTLLSETAAEQGFETESWTVDSGEAPRERDWVSDQATVQAELYFAESDGAEASAQLLKGLEGVRVARVREQAARDWDAEWKASFLSQAQGLVIPPGWHILPPWASDKEGHVKPGERVIRINPGAGFGTGTHETTQLCLTAIEGATRGRKIARALDFGSGSGILAIALAHLGVPRVTAVEIDPLAVDNAEENARINNVADRLSLSRELAPSSERFDLIVANILKPVLLEFADLLCGNLAAGGALVLSGLIERDVADVRARYDACLSGERASGEVRALGEWRCLFWPPGS